LPDYCRGPPRNYQNPYLDSESGSSCKFSASQSVFSTRSGAGRSRHHPSRQHRPACSGIHQGKPDPDLSDGLLFLSECSDDNPVTPIYHERLALELRVDAFHLLNHTEFQNLDNRAQDIGTTFGQVTSAYDPRILPVAAHLRF
jgi:hypothetical protein